jgi:hypothetical protein
MKPRRNAAQAVLGAAGDDPVALANRAAREARRAAQADDEVGVRQAAEKSWLAMSSLADVAADRLGKLPPRGAGARREILAEVEKQAKLHRGALVHEFEFARRILHGDCLHGDECPPDLVGLVQDYHGVVTRGMAAINKIKRRRR